MGFVVETPSLEPGLERTKPFELTPGDAIAIRLDLPASRCDAEPGPVVVRFDARTRIGTPDETGELVADDPFDTVARVNAADCLAESVADVAADRHARAPALDGRRRRSACVHRRRDRARGIRRREPCASTRVYGTTLLNAEDGIDWTLGLDVAAGEPRSVISLPVRPARCDAHAIADDKRGTILPFEIETADGRAGRLDVPASDGLKAELYAYYGERCGLQ